MYVFNKYSNPNNKIRSFYTIIQQNEGTKNFETNIIKKKTVSDGVIEDEKPQVLDWLTVIASIGKSCGDGYLLDRKDIQ